MISSPMMINSLNELTVSSLAPALQAGLSHSRRWPAYECRLDLLATPCLLRQYELAASCVACLGWRSNDHKKNLKQNN